MDRRETIKTLVVGSFASSFVLTGCNPDHMESGTTTESGETGLDTNLGVDLDAPGHGYGRTPAEQARDKELFSKTFFNEHEMATIAVLADIIIPADDVSGSATEAKVPEFIEFIVKDMPYHQVPLRGGLMWLDHESNRRFNKAFKDLTSDQQIEIVEDIAYPDDVQPEFQSGARFFSNMRNLVTTGFYTTRIGIDDLGYVGNQPNAWDGVPDDVQQKHNKFYREEYKPHFLKTEEREEIEDWANYEL